MKDEQHDILMEQAAIFKEGMDTQFWKELAKLMDNLRSDAIDRLLKTPPGETQLIAELQAIAKFPATLRQTMLDTVQYAEQARQ